MESMGPADALIFAFAAIVDLAVLFGLRWMRLRNVDRDRVSRSLTWAVRAQKI